MGLFGSEKAVDFSTTDEARFDWRLVVATLGIMVIGLINVYSATSNNFAGDSAVSTVLKQVVNISIGLAIIVLMVLFDYRLIERISYAIYGLNVAALAAVPLIGVVRFHARRWLNFGFMAYQPSETMKLATVLALAKYFNDKSSLDKLDFKDLVVPCLILGLPAVLTMAQPDLGTGGHLAICGGLMLLFVGIRPRVLLTAAIIAIVSFPLAWQYGLKSYQKERVKTFLDPMQDPRGQGYNALQSMIAVGSGEALGKGFKKGTQTQLEFTPEGHTDFIFTVLAEEWGFAGGLILFAFYLYLFHRCITIASLARDKFGSLTCVGIIGMLASQVFINVAMVCGIFPIVGIPLPLASYGGTSILTVCLALGILLNVGYRRTIF